MLIRTVTKGSTIVMKAINLNHLKQSKKAIQCELSGERAQLILKVQIGTQSILPLFWL